MFMDDFAAIPPEKLEAVRTAAKPIHFDKEYLTYDEIPMLQRLDASQSIYAVLDKDDYFWCRFWRVKGYHLAEANQLDKAKEAWRKSLEYCDRMLADDARQDERKELLVISGALRFLTVDRDAALAELRKVKGVRYSHRRKASETDAKRHLVQIGEEANDRNIKKVLKELNSENREMSKGLDDFLSELANEFIEALEPLPSHATWPIAGALPKEDPAARK
jgi:hypothetical protein